jgi:mRNA interferase HigB
MMKLIGKDRIQKFIQKHNQAKNPLKMWVAKTESAQWTNSADVKATFPTVDNPGDCAIFNIGGNRYRLMAMVMIVNETVIVKKIMTHAEYDKWNRTRR